MKWLKYIAYFLLGLLVLAGISYWMLDSDAPVGVKDDSRVKQMKSDLFTALNKDAWEQTKWVQWSFPREHDYIWDKERHLVQVKYDDHVVLLDPNAVDGVVYKNGVIIEGEERNKQVSKAYSNFTNDAFWLAAPFMIDQPGTEMTIASTEDGREGLMVEYTTGGVTPGDQYLWILGPDGKPEAYQMWVDIIPVGGTEASWEDWKQLKSGAWIAQMHTIGPASIPITNLRDGDSFRDFGFDIDPFTEIVKKK